MTKSNLKFHEGRVLIELAKSYPSIMDVIFEQVQNALDSNARMIWIEIDYKTKTLVVRDDGEGASREKFEQALVSVCRSIKDKKDSLGQFGIGLISPLGKCELFTFTSTPNTRSEYSQWTFVTNELEEQEELSGIPLKPIADIVYGLNGTPPRGKKLVPWRTEVSMHHFTRDKTLSRISLDTLEEEVNSRFGEKMRILHTMVHVKIKRTGTKDVEKRSFTTPEFSGEKLPVVKYVGKDCGETSFELFLSRKTSTGRKGKVMIHKKFDLFGVTAKAFIRSTQGILSVEIPDFLTSGIFEGKITTQHCTLLKERNGFEQNDALIEFCEHIEKWTKEHGAAHLGQIKDEEKDERYQELGRRSMRTIEEMLETPGFELLKEVLDSFKIGTIGSNHVDFEDTKKEDAVKSITTKEDSVKKEIPTDNNEKKDPETNDAKPQNHHENYEHDTTQGPRGQRRRIVRGHSTGLHFRYEELKGKVIWEFDARMGVLTFNLRHPLWERAEKDDTLLVRFQEFIAISVLTIETMSESLKEQHRLFVSEQAGYMLSLTERNMAPGRRKNK